MPPLFDAYMKQESSAAACTSTSLTGTCY